MTTLPYTIHGATCAGSILPHTMGQALSSEISRQPVYSAGDLCARGHYALRALTSLELRSMAVKTALQLLDTTAVVPWWDAGAADDGLVLRWALAASGGDGYDAGVSAHEVATIAQACVWLREIRWNDNGLAEIVLGGIALSSDGSALPVSVAAGDLATLETSRELWRVQSVSIAGTSIEVPGAGSISMPVQGSPIYPGAACHPTGCVLPLGDLVEPQLRCGVGDMSALRAMGLLGKEGACSVVLAPLQQDGSVGTGTITISMADATIGAPGRSGEAASQATSELVATAIADPDASPLTFSGV